MPEARSHRVIGGRIEFGAETQFADLRNSGGGATGPRRTAETERVIGGRIEFGAAVLEVRDTGYGIRPAR